MTIEYNLKCPACNKEINLVSSIPLEPRSGSFECGSCGQFYTVDKIDDKTKSITLIRLNREAMEKLMREKNML